MGDLIGRSLAFASRLTVMALVLWLPWAVDPSAHDQTEFPRRALLEAGLLVAAALGAVAAGLTPRIRGAFGFGVAGLLALALLVWALVGILHATSPAFCQEGIARLLVAPLVLLAGGLASASRGWRAALLGAIVLNSAAMAAIGVAQFAELHPDAFPGSLALGRRGLDMLRGTDLIGGLLTAIDQTDAPASLFGHTNFAGEFVLMGFVVAAILGVHALWRGIVGDRPLQGLRGLLNLALAAVMGLFLLRGGSRAVLLSAALVLGAVASVAFARRLAVKPFFGTRPRHVVAGAGILALIAGAAFVGLSNIEFEPRSGQPREDTWTRLRSAFDRDDTTVRERLDLWANTAAMAGDMPVFGAGAGNFPVAYPEWSRARRRHEGGRLGVSRQPESSHNTWLDVAAETGVPGIVLWTALMLSVIVLGARRVLRASDEHVSEAAALAGVLALLAASTFSFPFHFAGTSLYFWVLAAVVMGGGRPFVVPIVRGPASAAVLLAIFAALGVLALARGEARIEGSRAVRRALTAEDGASALRHLDAALARVPNHYGWELMRGEILRQVGRRDDARRSMERALDVHPNLQNAYLGLSSLALDEGDDAAAFAALSVALRLNPAEPRVHLNLGTYHERRRQDEQALSHYAQALAAKFDDPVRVQAHLALARMSDRLGDVLASIQHLDAARRMAPDSPEVIATEAEILERRSPRSEAALGRWKRLLGVVPHHAVANLHVGQGALKAGDAAAALRHFNLAYDADPRLTVALYHRALALLALGDVAAARSSLFECLKLATRRRLDRSLGHQCILLITELDAPTDGALESR